MSDTPLNAIYEYIQTGNTLRERFLSDNAGKLVDTARIMAVCLAAGGKILLCGNGGSAADAQHMASAFTNRFQMERPPLPALALTADASVHTAIGNDHGFDMVFSKQVQALGRSGDVLLGISTSGNSRNVVNALRTGRERGMVTVGLTSGSGGEMAAYCDYKILAPTESTCLVQEAHVAAENILLKMVDYFLFEAVVELQPFLDGANGAEGKPGGDDEYSRQSEEY